MVTVNSEWNGMEGMEWNGGNGIGEAVKALPYTERKEGGEAVKHYVFRPRNID
jgi:hypothetical protein